jgi:transposase-like protein
MAKTKSGPEFAEAALDALIGDTKTPEDLSTLFRQMQKRLAERILAAELTEHLGYAPGEEKPAAQPNYRNGSTPKTVLTESGALPLEIPRDRDGSFAPQLVPKGVRRLPQFDANVLSLYARGVTVREIQAHLEQLYQVEVSPALISAVTDGVLEEVTAWQQRPLDRMYPVVIFDALRVKIRDEGVVRNKAVYLALGVDREGYRDVLGLWIEQTEGARFWLRVMTELKGRGVDDILVALVDGLTGFPEAITTIFPQTQVHHCVVHLVRQSLGYVHWKDRRRVANELRAIYRAPTEAAADAALAAFAGGPWGERYAVIAALWQRHWSHIRPVFAYPPELRRMLYTTNAIESLHMQLRKILKSRGHFPTDEAATKLLYLALRNIQAKWERATNHWQEALPHLGILFGDRFTYHT